MISVGKLQWGRNFSVTEIHTTHALRHSGARFNGAVTFQLRKLENITHSNQTQIMLQWGRNFSVTEMIAQNSSKLQDGLLQWGRNFSVTEI